MKRVFQVFVFLLNLGVFSLAAYYFCTKKYVPFFTITGTYFLIMIGFTVFLALPRYLQDRKRFGKPIPPLSMPVNGMLNDELKSLFANKGPAETKKRKTFWGKPLFNILYEFELTNTDGLWTYSIETCNGKIVAYAYSLKSRHSEYLNYSFQHSGLYSYFLPPQAT